MGQKLNMLESISNVLKCDKKKKNNRVGMGIKTSSGPSQMWLMKKKSTIMERVSELEDNICKDAENAPEDNDKQLCWKWDQMLDMFLYTGCDAEYRISQDVGPHMGHLFTDLKKVEHYSIDAISKYTQKKRCCWSAILGVPFLIFGC